jgi:hypothetical protein
MNAIAYQFRLNRRLRCCYCPAVLALRRQKLIKIVFLTVRLRNTDVINYSTNLGKASAAT